MFIDIDREMNQETKNKVIGLAWADSVSFEAIEKQLGLTEADVIKIMRAELKPGSFRRWRKRVSGRATKHRKRFKHLQKGPSIDD